MSDKLEISESGGNSSRTPSPVGQSLKDNGTKVGYSSITTLDESERPVAPTQSAFDTADDVLHYKPISSYEGLHRWDPHFQWDEAEEKKVIRKV